MKGFYAGKWQSGSIEHEVTNPYSGELIGHVPLFGPEVLDEAFETLKKGAKLLSSLSREEHHQIFERLLALLIKDADEMAKLISSEQGKILREAKEEVEMTIRSAESLADSPSLVGARIQPLAGEASVQDRVGYTVRHPHGVVAIISPNPQPLILMALNTLYALAAGNAVLIKPSLHTPLIALRFVELLLQAGCPPEAIACVTGKGKLLGRAICKHRGVNHLICSASLPVIRDVRSQMEFVTSQLQWGCVATCVVGRTADLSRVADEVMRVAFECSGQAAFTPTWIACFEKMHDDLRSVLKERMEALVPGNPMDSSSDLGPLAEPRKMKKLEERIAFETSLGAELVTGGRVDGQLYRATLLDQCSMEKTRFSSREIAAPVIGMTAINKAEDATQHIRNQRHHILTLFSSDQDWSSRRAVSMPFNNVHVNGIPTWRDGLICLPGHPIRTGRRLSIDRVSDMSHYKDVVFHSS
ncbi:MAG: aldehyde dehydrogenase family protein [Verrucomicrobiales bacterium]|nr:aldehyde dehydrogenase family protein [Verrucomicrobiales bacterium]